MPRVTRRSVASKEPEENLKSPSPKKRGGKKEEAEEEPHGAPSKRGGRQAAKEESKQERATKGKAAARGRSTSRGGRGKKEEEPESEEEETVESEQEEEEEETVPKGGSRSKGKGASGEKSASRGARNTSRTGRGKAAEEEETSVKPEDNVEIGEPEETVPVKGRGSRGKGKAVAATPSPQAGRRGKAAAPAAEENKEKENEEFKDVDNEVDSTPTKGRQRNTPNKETPPSSSQRRGRGKKAETTPVTPTTPARSSRKAGASSASAEPEQEDDKQETEPMETEEDTTTSKAETEKVEPGTSEMVVGEPSEPSPSKKRKLEDDTDEHTVKRMRTSLSEQEKDAEIGDFIVISKDEVPAPDSKEVVESLPPAVTEINSQPTTPDDSYGGGPRIDALMAAPGVPVIVPLTEAEITKQYSTQERDKDETSSILVEVGSECASDITGLSSRGLDISDMVSLDSMDPTTGECTADPPGDPISPTSQVPPVSTQDPALQQLNDIPVSDQPILSQNNPSNAATEGTQIAAVDTPLPSISDKGLNADLPSSDTPEVPAGAASLENTNNNVATLSSQAISQNGTDEPTSTHLAPSTGKAASELYVPSSIAIDSRKFILNPSFPVEMMDPAFCFSVVSYNILADCHMRRSDYSYTEPQYLEQEYRHKLMLKELDYLDGDIVCMQEVNPAYYTQTLLPAMKSRGYDGHFIKRTKEFYDEGEATFVRTAKFDIISHQSLLLGELAHKEVDDSGLNEEVSKAAKKYLDRADVILLTELNCKKTGKVITVCNIHIVYDLKAPDAQCIQVACAIKQLVAKAGNDLNPHIICGDFNSVVTSPSYQLAKDGYLSDDHIHKLQALHSLDNTDGSSGCLINHMWRSFQHTSSNLRSSYELTLGKEPPITSFTKATHQTLDYIFHSAASIDTVGILETLDLQVVDATGGLPSASIPSDHLSLKAVFRLK